METHIPISVAYADDHKLVRASIVNLLNEFPDINVAIEADNGRDLINLIDTNPEFPDIVVLDINMPVLNGFDTVLELKHKWHDIRILVLTAFENEYFTLKMIAAGVNGYLLKKAPISDLRQAIRCISQTGKYFPESLHKTYIGATKNHILKQPRLTPMEIRVLKQLNSDLSYKEIAQNMKTTTRSIEGYRDSLFKKLNVNSRVSLVVLGIQMGIIQVPSCNNAITKNYLKQIK